MIVKTITMFRTPIQSSEMSMLEHCGAEQLLGIFRSYLQTGSRRAEYGELAEAWGILFSDMYLSAEELVYEMQSGKHRLGEDNERMLCEFIRADCADRGAFVMDVIKKGGKIDRAALIMIADLENLATVEENDTTAIHLLAEACDKGVRPALIKKAGKRLLGELYDSRGIPALFSILTLGDVCRDDLDAIEKVFTNDDLKQVMHKEKRGKTALEVFVDASTRLKSHAPGERNKFMVVHAVKTTNLEGDLRSQVSSHGHEKRVSGAQVQAADNKNAERGEGEGTGDSGRFDELMSDPLDDISKTMRRTQRTK